LFFLPPRSKQVQPRTPPDLYRNRQPKKRFTLQRSRPILAVRSAPDGSRRSTVGSGSDPTAQMRPHSGDRHHATLAPDTRIKSAPFPNQLNLIPGFPFFFVLHDFSPVIFPSPNLSSRSGESVPELCALRRAFPRIFPFFRSPSPSQGLRLFLPFFSFSFLFCSRVWGRAR
jgi:hypothetical protein